ncbi:MAG TPA: hypothetical protein VHM23_06730, partial [Actinomycetota bacterium]|nr:hypothetical protein [Actinomycetota bacterium]
TFVDEDVTVREANSAANIEHVVHDYSHAEDAARRHTASGRHHQVVAPPQLIAQGRSASTGSGATGMRGA